MRDWVMVPKEPTAEMVNALRRHHECCIGVMALCYEHVPDELKEAIRQGVAAARELGFECDPNNLGTGLPLCMNQ